MPSPTPDNRRVTRQPLQPQVAGQLACTAVEPKKPAAECKSAGQPNAGEPPQMAAGLVVLAFAPQFVRSLYWRLCSVSAEARLAAALRDSKYLPATFALRMYGISDQEGLKAVVAASCGDNPSEGLIACAKTGIKDPEFVLPFASAISTPMHASVLCRMMSRLPFTQGQRLALAETCARLSPVRFAEKIANFGIASAAEEHRLLKIAAENDRSSDPGRGMLRYFWGAKRLSHEQRLDILLTVAEHHPAALGAAMKRRQFGAEPVREQLLLAASRGNSIVRDGQSRITVARYVEAFGVSRVSVRAEAARNIASRSGGDLARHIALFALGANTLRELALQAAVDTEASPAFLVHVDNFCLKDSEALKRVGKAHALSNGWLSSFDLDRFGIESIEERRELARALTHSFGLPTAQHVAYTDLLLCGPDRGARFEDFFWRYGYTPVEVSNELLPLAARQHPETAISALSDLGLSEAGRQIAALKMIAGASAAGTTRVVHSSAHPFTSDEVRALVFGALGDVQDAWLLGTDDDLVHRAMNLVRGIIREQGPLWVVLPDEVAHQGNVQACVEVLRRVGEVEARVDVSGWDLEGVRLSQSAALYVVCAYHLARPLVEGLPQGTRVRESVRLVSGHDALPVQELSAARFQQLCELLGSFHYDQTSSGSPCYRISRDAWRKSFREVLDLLVASSALGGARSSAVGDPAQVQVTPATVGAHTRALTAEAERSFAKDFGLDSAAGIVALQGEWGDLVPLTVLMGRFRAGREQQVVVLRQIVKHVLEGSFYDWKYDPAFGQLAGMSDAQVSAWRRNPVRVSHCTAEQSRAMAEQKQLAEAEALVDYCLLPHVPEAYAGELFAARRSAEDVLRARELSPEQFAARAPTTIDVVCDLMVLRRAGLRKALFEYLKRYEEARGAIRPIEPPQADQLLRKDISRIFQAVRDRTVDSSKAYLVVSAVVDHPKLLLTIGDLVNVSSCLNYRSGNTVDALPAYVMDSNIKASLSFAVAENRLRSLCKIPKGAPLELSELSFRLNPARLSLEVSLRGGAPMELDLGKAVHRHVLRLGRSEGDGRPALLVEQRYHQFHAVTSHIESEQAALLAELRSACGLREASAGAICFPASRNPGGVYSDAMGRICRSAFRWEPAARPEAGLIQLRDD